MSDPQDLPDLGALYARHDEDSRVWREERRSSGDRTIGWELIRAEEKHLAAQEPAVFSAENRPKPGTIVVGKDGDAWEFGRSRWTQISGNGRKYLRVPGLCPASEYGPYRIIGRRFPGSKPSEWVYRTIRPRKPRG